MQENIFLNQVIRDKDISLPSLSSLWMGSNGPVCKLFGWAKKAVKKGSSKRLNFWMVYYKSDGKHISSHRRALRPVLPSHPSPGPPLPLGCPPPPGPPRFPRCPNGGPLLRRRLSLQLHPLLLEQPPASQQSISLKNDESFKTWFLKFSISDSHT